MHCTYCNTPNAGDATVCVACGVALSGNDKTGSGRYLNALPPGTVLQGGAFLLSKVLGEGGFGLTYLATDTRLKRPAANTKRRNRNLSKKRKPWRASITPASSMSTPSSRKTTPRIW